MSSIQAATARTTAILALGCALALAAPAPAGAADEAQGGEITPGKGVGPITLSMALDDLTRLWGAPAQKGERDQDGVVLYDYSEARGVIVFLKDDRVVQFVVVTPAWSTPSGARVGATWPQVRAFLGQPDETLPGQTKDESRYLYRQRGIAFILKGRTVAAIVVLAAQGAAPSKSPLDDILGTGKARGQGGR
jgi:hypothetical protein